MNSVYQKKLAMAKAHKVKTESDSAMHEKKESKAERKMEGEKKGKK